MKRVSRLETIIVVLLLALSLALRLTDLDAFVANDEIRWTCRSIQFRAALREKDWAGTFRVGHPGVVTTWIGAIFVPPNQHSAEAACRTSERGRELDKIEASREGEPHTFGMLGKLLFAGRVGVALFNWVSIALTFWLVRLLWGTRVATFSLVLIGLDPFYLALSRVLHIDAVLTSLLTLSLLSLMVSLQGERSRIEHVGLMILSGAAGGLAMLEKSPAMFLAPFAILVIAIAALRRRGTRHGWGRAARDLVLWGLAASVVYMAFWPAMWVDPMGTAEQVLSTALGYAEEGHEPGGYFLGIPVDEPGWGFYPVVLLFRMSPLAFVGLIAGLLWLVGERERSIPRFDVFILLLYSLLFSLFMSLGAKKLDRYLLPVFPSLGIVAAVGLLWTSRLAQPLLSSISPSFHQGAFWSAILLLQLVVTLPHHPHYLTYYNPLVGGVRRAQDILKVGWGEGYEEAAAYLNDKPNAERLQVVAPNFAAFAPLFSGEARPMGDYSASQTDYVLFYLAQVQRRHDEDLMEAYYENPEARPEHTVTLHGVDYVWIYPNRAYVQPLHYLEEHSRPEQDILLINRDSVLNKRYRGTLTVRQFHNDSGPEEVADLLDHLPSGRERIWYPHHAGTDPDTVLRLLQNRALLVEQQSFAEIDVLSYRLLEGSTISEPLDLCFGDLRLVRYQTTDPPPAWGRDGGVLLHWKSDHALNEDYTGFVHLYDSHGHRIAQADSLIVNQDLRPTSEWTSGSSGVTLHHLSIPAGTPPGRYRLRVGVYNLETGERLPLLDAGSEQQGTVAHLEAEVGVPDRLPDPSELPIAHPLERDLTASLRLLGYDLEYRGVPAGEEIPLKLFWQAVDRPPQDYRLQLGLLDAEGKILEQQGLNFVSNDYSTSQWRQGELIQEHYCLSTDESLSTGEVTLTLNLLDQNERTVLKHRLNVATIWVQSKGPSFDVPPDIDPSNEFTLGDKISLVGYDLDPEELSPGDILQVTLYWRANAEIGHSYKVFVHLYDEKGNLVGQRDRIPGLGIRPTTSWEREEVIADRYNVELSGDLVPGTYSIAVGMYDADNGERVPALGPNGERLVQDRVLLGGLGIR